MDHPTTIYPPRIGRRLAMMASVIVGGLDIGTAEEVMWSLDPDNAALADAEEKRTRKAAKRARDAEHMAAGRKGR
jgi:hypothetical protein